MTGAEIAETLTRWLAQGATGAVEWKDERRRRIFFMQAGQLVALQSNLKSESPQRVKERFPELDPEDLRVKVAEERLRGALEELDGTVQGHIGVEPPSRESLDLLALLWRVADTLPGPPDQSFPRLRPGGAALVNLLPAPAALLEYLVDLDGTRSLEDVVSFGPCDPQLIGNGVAIATLLGAVETQTEEVPNALVTTQRIGLAPMATATRQKTPETPPPATPPRAAPTPTRVTEEDIGNLIDEAMGGESIEAHGDSNSYEVRIPRAATATPASTRPAAAPRSPSTPRTPLQRDAEPVSDIPGRDEADRGTSRNRRLKVLHERIVNAATHFDVLGVDPGDALGTIRRSWLEIAKDLHPDRWTDASDEDKRDVTRLFDKARGAWEVLGDDKQREAYISRVIRGEKTEDEKAMERVKEILEAEGDYKRGVSDLNAGRLIQAHDLFTRAVAKVPEEPEFVAYHGYTTFRLALGRDEAKAEEGFRRVEAAVRDKDRFDQGYVLMGMMYRAMGHEDKARAHFIAALKIKPTNPDASREMKRDPSRNPVEPAGKAKPGLFAKFFGKK